MKAIASSVMALVFLAGMAWVRIPAMVNAVSTRS